MYVICLHRELHVYYQKKFNLFVTVHVLIDLNKFNPCLIPIAIKVGSCCSSRHGSCFDVALAENVMLCYLF